MSETVPRCARAFGDRFDHPTRSTKRRGAASGGAVFGAFAWLLVLTCAAVCGAQVEELATQSWLRIETRADACIAASTLRREIESLLAGRRPAHVAVRVGERDQGWIIELWHANGQHALRAFPELPDGCAERLRAIALATVLAVEHAVEATAAGVNEQPQRPDAVTSWAFGIHSGASVGELTTPAPLLGIDARIERGAWVPIELLALVDVRASEARLAGAALATRQVTGGLGTCLGGSWPSWRIDGCLGVELGAVLGYAARLPQATRDSAGSGALNLGLAARWSPRAHLALTARIEGFVRFWVPRFQVLDAEGELFAEQRLPLAGGRLRLGLSWLSR